MLTSIRQVNEEFFRTFYGLKITVGGEEKPILCRYARKSSKDYVEEQENQMYPCIAIQDYTPTIKREWYVDMKSYFGGKSLDGLTGYLFRRPIWMEFRYDVSIAAKSYNDFLAMQDYFMENFVYEVRLIFNKQLSGEDLVGDIVPYTIRENYIPRTDGVYEINYEFTCSVWLYAQKAVEVALVQLVVVGLHPTTTEQIEALISSGNSVTLTKDGYLYGSSGHRSDLTAEQVYEEIENIAMSNGYKNVRKIRAEDYSGLTGVDDKTLYILVKDD